MWNNKLFLLGLITVLCIAAGAFIACSTTSSSSSTDDDTVDDDFVDDDDDNDASPDDDDDASDCAVVASALTDCAFAHPLPDINGNTPSTAGYTTWCGYSESYVGGSGLTPFWSCCEGCTTTCDQTCLGNCMFPADPGGNGCGHAIYKIYACEIALVFNANPDDWIGEQDLQAVCTDGDAPWACFIANCAPLACSATPTQAQIDAMNTCVGDCLSADDDDDSSPSS